MHFIWFYHELKNRSLELYIVTFLIVLPQFSYFIHTLCLEFVWFGFLGGFFFTVSQQKYLCWYKIILTYTFTVLIANYGFIGCVQFALQRFLVRLWWTTLYTLKEMCQGRIRYDFSLQLKTWTWGRICVVLWMEESTLTNLRIKRTPTYM